MCASTKYLYKFIDPCLLYLSADPLDPTHIKTLGIWSNMRLMNENSVLAKLKENFGRIWTNLFFNFINFFVVIWRTGMEVNQIEIEF